MTLAPEAAAPVQPRQRHRWLGWLAQGVVVALLAAGVPLWLVAGRVELSETPGSAVGEVPVSLRPEVRFVGVADGLRWVDIRARPAEARPATIRTTLVDERNPERPVATWTVTLTAPGPVWMEMPPIAQSAGVPYRVVIEPAGADQPEVWLRLVLDRQGDPVVAVQRFYRTSPRSWLAVMGARLDEAGVLAPVLAAGSAVLGLLALVLALVVWRVGLPPAPGWTLAGLLALAWGVVAIQAAASARLWAQLTVAWPDGP